MPVKQETLNSRLYDELRANGFDPKPLSSQNKVTPVPEADVFELEFKNKNGNQSKFWVTVTDSRVLSVYYDDSITDSDEDEWYKVIQRLRRFSVKNSLEWEPKNRDHINPDMEKRTYMKEKAMIGEGYHPMGKKTSINDSVPQVKIILQHTRQIEEGEQRFRNIAKIFVENTNGERFLVPTIRPGVARVYARHVAEGGTPYDDKGKHITSLVEEYTKMAGFVRATKNGQFNESAQQLVNEGISHYKNLRETLTRMTTHRGYNNYFDNWAPVLNEEIVEESNLNELFVQEILDPRIESVMPILKRLSKNINKMNEVKELEEWAESITEVEDETTKTLAEPASDMLDEIGIGTLKSTEWAATERIKQFEKEIERLKKLGDSANVAKYEKALKHYTDLIARTKSHPNTMDTIKTAKTLGSIMPAKFKNVVEAPGAETLGHNQSTQKKNLKAFDLEEEYKVKYEVVDKDNKHLGTWDGMVFVPYDRSKFPAGKMDKIPAGSRVDKESGPLDNLHVGMGKIGMEEADVQYHHVTVNGNSIFKTKDAKKAQDFLQAMKSAEEFKNKKIEVVGRPEYVSPVKEAPGPETLGHNERTVKSNLDAFDLEETVDGQFAGDYEIGEPAQWRNKGPKANKPAMRGDLVGESEMDKLKALSGIK